MGDEAFVWRGLTFEKIDDLRWASAFHEWSVEERQSQPLEADPPPKGIGES